MRVESGDPKPSGEGIAGRPRPVGVVATVLIGAVSFAHLVRSPGLLTAVSAVVVLGLVIGGARRRAPSESAEHLVFAGGITLLSLAHGGLVRLDDPRAPTAVVATVVAYLCIAKVLLQHVRRRHLVRARDLVVDAVLIGAAASVLFQAVVLDAEIVGSLGISLPSIFIGLDVMLVVIAGRSLTVPGLRQGVLPASIVAGGLLAISHGTSATDIAGGAPPSSTAVALVAATIGLMGAAAVMAVRSETRSLVSEPPLFSIAHAGVLVLASLAAPVLLAADVVRGLSISTGVAVTSMLSAAVLGGHLVELLRERATSEHQSMHDPLTGLANRKLFVDRLDRAIAHARRSGTTVGVLYIDLDRFKDVNDTFGHSAGDRLLQRTARRLEECCRDADTVARLAGDEFAVLLAHLDGAEAVQPVADRVLDAISETWMVAGQSLRGAGSVGVAIYPNDGDTSADLLAASDAAMYQAKDKGGRSVELFSTELAATAATRLEIETDLHHAIQGEGLELYYQPIVDATTGQTCGAEALIRWHHPEKGFLSPASFIPIAEQSELIVEVGQWALHEACTELVRLAEQGHGDRFVTVNISSRHFRHDVVSAVTGALRATGANPRRLVVELTESAAVDDLEVVASSLRDLADLGVRAAIDDFGTGYCGLQYLGDLTIETLKIDRSFVQHMTARSAAIVAATIAMGHSLGMSIVAEGVETVEQQRFLKRAGCDRVQGYLLGRPAPAGELRERFAREGPLSPEGVQHLIRAGGVRPMSQA